MTTTPLPAATTTDPGAVEDAPWVGHQQTEPTWFGDPAAARSRRPRRLGVLAGRILLYGTLALVFAVGLKRILTGPQTTGAPRAAGEATATSVSAAEAVAGEFAAAYLTWPDGGPDKWRAALTPYLAAGTTLLGGWDGTGTQTVSAVIPAGTDQAGPDAVVVTVAARLGTGSWVHLAVPLSTAHGAIGVSDAPTFVPGPTRPGRPPASPAGPAKALGPDSDPAAASQAAEVVAKFFTAYAAGDHATLAYLSIPSADIPAGLGGTVTLAVVDGLTVGAGPGPVRDAQVNVRWALPGGGTLTQTYALRLEERDGRWYLAGPPHPDTPSSPAHAGATDPNKETR